VLEDVLDYLQAPFVVLSGTPVTLLSVATALAIIVTARILAGVLGRSVARTVNLRAGHDGVGFAIGKILRWSVTIAGVFVGVSTIGINMNAIFAASAVLLVGIGFGLQKMAENFVSGVILLIERPVRKGDFVSVAGVLGNVEDIGLRATNVVSRDGITAIVPNSELISASVINHSVPTTTLRIWVRVGVAYGTDLATARQVLLDVAAAEPRLLVDPPPEVMHEGFNDSSIDLAIVAWIARAREDLVITSDLRFAIAAAFRRNGITIPFPQRDVHVRTLPEPVERRIGGRS
jgi:small-conductance mechanosensitive channel